MEQLLSADEDLNLWLMVGTARHAMLTVRRKELVQYNITPRQAYILQTIQGLGDSAFHIL